MYIYWLYAFLSIFYSWIILTCSKSYKNTIIFYSISVLFILIYFIFNIIIEFIVNIRYSKKISQLNCMKNRLKKDSDICGKYVYCSNNLFCNETKDGRCTSKFTNNQKFIEAIDSEINKINITKKNEIKDTDSFLDKYYIKKYTFDKTLKIYIIYLSLFFVIYFLLIIKDTDINLDLSGLNMNYIRKKLK